MKRLRVLFICLSFLCLGFFNAFGQSKDCDCAQFTAIEKEIKVFYNSESRDSNELQRLYQYLLKSGDACKVKAYEFLAEYAYNFIKIDTLENYLNLATAQLKKNGCNEKLYFRNYALWADLFYLKSNYNESLNNSYRALNIAEELNDDSKKAFILMKIAQIFNRMKQSDKGINYARQSVALMQRLPPSVEKAQLLNQAAARYYYYYQDSKNKNLLDSTLIFTKEAKLLGLQFNNRKVLIQAFSKLESVEFENKNYTQAFIYNDSVLKYCIPDIHDRDLYIAYGDKGEKYLDLKNYPAAKRYADSSIYYAKKSNDPVAIANALSLLFEVASRSGNWKEATAACEAINSINDTLFNIEKSKSINELEKKYNQAKNEKTIKELAQEKRIYLLLALAALLGIVIFIFYLRQQKLKHNQIIMETEQRLNRARMNPHFFFNALTSLQSFALRENDGKSLASNISKFSHIMRETLESSYKEYVTIEQEMEFLNEYLEIQKIRFPKKFSYEIKAENDVEIDELLIPSMILQPFVENSIEHGFAGLEEEGHVEILFKKAEKEVLIEISDNGKGLNTSPKITNEHISRASQIIKDRIYLLNIKLKTKARFSIDNQDGGKGVQVKIYLPQIFENESTNR